MGMKADCANCRTHACYTKAVNCTGVDEADILAAYSEEERRIMKAAAYVEGTFYSNITRLEETAEFAKAMGYHRLGLAFCIGLNAEARYIARFYTKQGFECYSVCCKNCSFAKKELGLKQVKPELEHEAMCNPKFQANFLADKGVELFISCGLCVGHDALFNAACPGPSRHSSSKTACWPTIPSAPSTRATGSASSASWMKMKSKRQQKVQRWTVSQETARIG